MARPGIKGRARLCPDHPQRMPQGLRISGSISEGRYIHFCLLPQFPQWEKKADVHLPGHCPEGDALSGTSFIRLVSLLLDTVPLHSSLLAHLICLAVSAWLSVSLRLSVRRGYPTGAALAPGSLSCFLRPYLFCCSAGLVNGSLMQMLLEL